MHVSVIHSRRQSYRKGLMLGVDTPSDRRSDRGSRFVVLRLDRPMDSSAERARLSPLSQDQERCLVMGILNVTADSFSDGGRWEDRGSAVTRGNQLAADGADIIDVGGESTRPGAQRTPEWVERSRVMAVVAELAQAGLVVSIDTMRAAIARGALEAGARIINDVSGGLADPAILRVARDFDAVLIINHWRGHSASMDDRAEYRDVVSEVIAELDQRCDAALAAGVSSQRIVIDPGLGFAKRSRHNWQLLESFPRLRELGFPVLVGASRKRFLADACRLHTSHCVERDAPTHAISALVAASGAWGVRVHEPRATADAVRVVSRLKAAGASR